MNNLIETYLDPKNTVKVYMLVLLCSLVMAILATIFSFQDSTVLLLSLFSVAFAPLFLYFRENILSMSLGSLVASALSYRLDRMSRSIDRNDIPEQIRANMAITDFVTKEDNQNSIETLVTMVKKQEIEISEISERLVALQARDEFQSKVIRVLAKKDGSLTPLVRAQNDLQEPGIRGYISPTFAKSQGLKVSGRIVYSKHHIAFTRGDSVLDTNIRPKFMMKRKRRDKKKKIHQS